MAVRRGLHVSEHGILDDATGTTHGFATEEEVYAFLGLPYVEPELREDRGELDRGFAPPKLIEQRDLRGDLHCHTVASDGKNTIEEMARAALERGLEYLAITDHSASHGFGNDVSPDALRRHMDAVRATGARVDGITLLAGTEVNVLPDGSLDYEDDLLAELDWVVASVHTAFRMDEAQMTARIVRALEHPLVDVLGHPTGRLIGKRRGVRGRHGRGDRRRGAHRARCSRSTRRPTGATCDDIHARAAAAAGVRLLIDSDAHRTATLANTRWGVATARRAWLGAADVANTLPWDELQRCARAPHADLPEQAGDQARRAPRGRRRRACAGPADRSTARRSAAPGRRARCAAPPARSSLTSRRSSARAMSSATYGPGAGVVTSRQPSASASSWAMPWSSRRGAVMNTFARRSSAR